MLRIGLLGLGHVGSAVVEALGRHGRLLARRTGRPPALLRIGVRHLHKPRRITVDPALLTADAWQVVRDPRVDLLIEAIGGVEPAASYLREALRAGKDVITANKQLVAAHGPELRALAAERGRAFLFEAAVGAALPIVQVINTALAGDRIRGLVGVLNGTANYVLTRIERGATREEALDDARALGLAEPDPHDDLSGRGAHRAGEVFLQANGAGGPPTASAILGDLARAAGQGEAFSAPAVPAIVPLRSGNGTATDGQLVLDGWA